MRATLRALSMLLLPALSIAQTIDIPVTNWTVPPYTQSSGITTMTDFTPPRAFVAVAPCRVVDTRNANGPYGGPPLATNVSRTFDIDNGPCAGLPSGIDAYSLSFGAILPPADGFLTAWPTGTAQPLFSQVNLIAGEVVANAAIVPAGTNGAINVLVNIGPTHVYIDINGYFSDTHGAPGNSFELENNSNTATAFLFNLSTTCSGVCGLTVITNSGNAIYGLAEESTSDGNVGVFGTTKVPVTARESKGPPSRPRDGEAISPTRPAQEPRANPTSREFREGPIVSRPIPRESKDPTEQHLPQLSTVVSRLPAFGERRLMPVTASWA